MSDPDNPKPGDGHAYWKHLGETAFPRRTAEITQWAADAESTWLVELVRRRLAGHRDRPIDGSELVNEAFLDLLDRLRIGVGVLDVDLRVYFSNRVLGELIEGEPRLALNDGQMTCRDSRFAERLGSSLATVVAGTGVVPGCALRLDGTPPLLLYATPAITPADNQAGTGPLVCLFAARDDSREPVDSTDVAQWFDLTAAEAELATCFAYGESLKDYAARRKLSLNTVRNQFAAAKAKLGADSQADVVRRILLGNPLAAFSHVPRPPG